MKVVEKQVKETEAQIKDTLEGDEDVKKHFKLLCSVPGVGLITAVALIIYTHNFSAFDDSRKFVARRTASYCGPGRRAVAPFEYRSGSSIRATVAAGQTRISQYANKRVKALLTNGASSAIQHDEEIRSYYQRKIAEGKSRWGTTKMVVVNAVRAKLINRAFATGPRRL
ncbi:MAG: transposase [Cyclobacteriaceae bacterium]